MDRPIRDVKSHGSKVVFFSNLPREEDKKRELLTVAGRFGSVDKHLFLSDQVNLLLSDQVNLFLSDQVNPALVLVPPEPPWNVCGDVFYCDDRLL